MTILFWERPANKGKVKAQKKTAPSALRAARRSPLVESAESDNPVKRIGAFFRDAPEKAALGTSYRRRVVAFAPSGQSQAHPHRLTSGLCGAFSLYRGGYTRPSESLAGWQSGYTHFNATAPIFLGSHFGDHAHAQLSETVGARSDPPNGIKTIQGCAVNTNDSASGLIRFTRQGTLLCGPNGWGRYA